MRVFFGFIFVVFYFLIPARSFAQSTVPDIKDWNVQNISRIELRISDDAVAYMGVTTDYINPSDSREFIRVIRRHIPVIILKHRDPNEKMFGEMVATFYTKKEEQDRLEEASSKSDPIVYIRWRAKDHVNGTFVQDGDFTIWLFDGVWNSFVGMRLDIQFLSESVNNGKRHNVFSGMEYRVGSVYHIHRIDRNDLRLLFGEGE